MRLRRLVPLVGAALAVPLFAGEPAYDAALTVRAGEVLRPVPPLLAGQNLEWVWSGQGLFSAQRDRAEPVEGFAPLLRALKPGLLRYPGGSLANTFRFASALGPIPNRQPVANFFLLRGKWEDGFAPWKGEKPVLGFDDFMRFVGEAGAAGALITVNCTEWPRNPELSGSPQEAAAWVAYANARVGDAPVALGVDRRGTDWRDSQHWARLREHNARREPYSVRDWEIGNEVCEANQGAGMTGETYAARLAEFSRLMKSVDPTVRVGAVLHEELAAWNAPVLAKARPPVADFAIVHAYGPGALRNEVPFWSSSRRDFTVSVPADGKYTLALKASGQPANKVWPQMRVAWDGAELGEVTVDADRDRQKRKEFSWPLEARAGIHTLTVAFPNDEYVPPEDRNLYLEEAALAGTDGKRLPIELMSIAEALQTMSAYADWFALRLAKLREAGLAVPLQVTEFNALYGMSPAALRACGELKSALYAARQLQVFLEDPSVEAANFWCIRSEYFRIVQKGTKGLVHAPAGLVYRAFGPLLRGNALRLEWTSRPTFETILPPKVASWVAAAGTRDEKKIALNFVNWHPTRIVRVHLDLDGAAWGAGAVRLLAVTGPNAEAMNEEGQPPTIGFAESDLPAGTNSVLELRPLSVTTAILPLNQPHPP